MMCKVSIIVAAYNAEKDIKKCVESILSQTYKAIEIILINDGSIDATKEIIADLAKKDTRIIYINQSNKGVSAARNQGLSIASGDYIQFVDSDDIIEPNAVETLVSWILKTESDLVICGMKSTDGEKHYSSRELLFINNIQAKYNELYKYSIINSPCNKLYNRNLIISPFDETLSLGEDLVFNNLYIKNCRQICVIPDELYIFRRGSLNSLSGRIYSNSLGCIYKMVKSIEELLENQNVGIEIYRVFSLQTRNIIVSLCKNSRDSKMLKEWYRQWLSTKFFKELLCKLDKKDLASILIKKGKFFCLFYIIKVKQFLQNDHTLL